ncbi:DUF308 domain-containing protein [Candidatus Micrarchaeota archaeon]|nr:DUF308 domain-containing protein [Candidatus Micrarchaeota archaeon]
MKITNEGSRLVLKDNNYIGFILGALMIVLGLFSIYSSLKSAGYLVDLKEVGIVIGALFTVLGLYSIISNKIVRVVFDKGSGRCFISFRKLIGEERKEFQLSRIKQIELRKILKSSGTRSRSMQYQFILVIKLDSKEEVPLEFGKVSASVMDVVKAPDDEKRADSQMIADFLGMPLEVTGPPSVNEMLSTIKEAIGKRIEKETKKSD